MIGRLFLSVTLVVGFCGIVVAQKGSEGASNMTGVWKLNHEKSDFGNGPTPAKDKLSVFTVSHSEPEITFSVIGFGTDNSPLSMSYSGALDNKFHTMSWNGNQAELKLWRVDQYTTKGVMRASIMGNTVELETHTIVVAKDGKSFIRTGVSGGMKQVLYYEKQ